MSDPKKAATTEQPAASSASGPAPVPPPPGPAAQSLKKPPPKMTAGDASEFILQRESLMLRMKHMEEKLDRRKSHQKEIEGDVRKLQALLDGERENNAEICTFYKKQLAEKTKEALALEDKLAGVEASHEAKRQGLVQELEAVKSKRAEEAAAAEAEISKLKSEVGSLNEFRRKRAEHDAALEELRVKSEAEIKMLKDILATSEQRTAAMREEMEKQKEDELRKIRQAMFSSAYEKLDGVTKATVAENDRLAGQLAKQSKQAEALLRENKRLKDECAELKRKVDMLESLEREQAKRSQSAKRSVKALEEKLSQRDEEIQKLQATRPASPVAVLAPAAPVTEARESAGPMKSRIRELEAELEHLRRSNERYRGELSRAEFAIEDAARVREEYHALLEKHDESTWFLLSALDDAKSHVLDAAGDASEEKPKLDEFSREDREKVISFFLGKLHTYKLAASEGILRAAVPALPREFG